MKLFDNNMLRTSDNELKLVTYHKYICSLGDFSDNQQPVIKKMKLFKCIKE